MGTSLIHPRMSPDQVIHGSKSLELPRKEDALHLLEAVLQNAGYDAGDLQIALEAIDHAKKIRSNKKKETISDSYYIDKTLIYEDHEAFIYTRADHVRKNWYFSLWDSKSHKPVRRALKTTDKTQAITRARLLYVEIKGKIDRGERLKSINTIELIQLWDEKVKAQITNIPHEGITEGRYKVIFQHVRHWKEYIDSLGLLNTAIDRIEPHRTRDFGTYLKNKPKRAYKNKPRNLQLINSNISEIKRMYKELAVRDKYISASQVPEIDFIKTQKEEGYKRDIFTEEQYERLWRYIQFTYVTKKHNPERTAEQLEIRKIWKEFIFILSNVGFRPKELLGIRMHEITDNPNWDTKRRETDLLMKVCKENSKTGRARVCVAPVKKRIERVLDSYRKLGITHEPTDVLFISYQRIRGEVEERKPYSREVFACRLNEVLKASGLQEELDREGKSITLYSFRHQYACWRLRYGDVPIHLLAKQMGTSIQKIEQTYGHIEVEQQADLITKAQDHIKKAGFILNKPEVIEEEDINYMAGKVLR
ncbi:tyrosine-type recombinase/integrase [Prochlorococcus marinus]|uniref:tyrosine-type recombinase/integrase n=2 Tax=Prochlorococcus TaxID=1218 RepID=UPI001F28E8D5|nr:tyrosine-type recombinase/integrase [Prochlorococcus marinus]